LKYRETIFAVTNNKPVYQAFLTCCNKSEIWQRWNEIPAVANKHIYPLDGELLHRFGPRAIDGLSALCAAIDKAR
jgi:vitamin B12 transport system substrate-binding protein